MSAPGMPPPSGSGPSHGQGSDSGVYQQPQPQQQHQPQYQYQHQQHQQQQQHQQPPQHYPQHQQPPPPPPEHQLQHQQQAYDPSAMKLTRGTSCVLCQQRKVRCDKNKPCANCVKAKVECRVVPPQPPRRRKKRLQERDLIDRLKKYESLLSEHGVKFEAIGQDLRPDGPQDEVEDLNDDFHELNTSPEANLSPLSNDPTEKASSSIFAVHKEFRAAEKLIQDSSEDEAEGGLAIHKAFDKLFSNEDGFPFQVGGSFAPVQNAHPNPIHIFQLWQIYIDNINTLLKITHVPTIQPQVLEAASRLDKAPKNIEALMFGIYLMAITSLEEKDVQRIFNEPKQQLLTKYLSATQQALINAKFLRDDDAITLQAFVLYLFAVRWFIDPRQVFCLVGMAVRIAQRMGLHRDPGGYGLPPFEVEQRRRLWWTIVGYDRRIGEITGSTVTALSSGGDCKIPLNVNDSDLHVEGKELPKPHNGPTEMLFALTRVELAMAVASNSNRDAQKVNNPEKGASPPASTPSRTGTSSSGPTIRLAYPDSPTYTLDGFCAHIEGTYLSQCDPKIPLHFFTLTMTRQALCKMRVVSFLVRMHNAEAMPLKEVEKDSLFLQATQMIEYDNVVQSSESLIPFQWYARHHFPFPAYMFIVQELRSRVSGLMVERAWDAIAANHELRGLINNFHNPMHVAFKNTFIKAWDAHESAQLSAGKQIPTPRFIVVLKERAEERRREKAQPPSQAENKSPGSAPQPPQSSHGGSVTGAPHENLTMMTPPGASPANQQMMGTHASSVSDDQDMDWSYMVSGYQDPPAPQFPNSFGPMHAGFGGPLGPMGGGGGGPGPGPMSGGPMGGHMGGGGGPMGGPPHGRRNMY